MKIQNRYKLMLLIAMLVPLVSCNEQIDWFEEHNYMVKDPYVEVLDAQEHPIDQIEALYQGGSLSVWINSNTAWTVTVNTEAKMWCMVNPPSTSGNSRLMIRVLPHSTIRPRKAQITITYGSSEKILDLTQDGTPLLSMNETRMAVIQSTQGLTINAAEGDEWVAEVLQGADWLSLSATQGTGPSTISLSGSTNQTGAERPAKVLFKTAFDPIAADYLVVDELSVVQKDKMDPLIVDFSNRTDTLGLKWGRVLGASYYKVVARDKGTSNLVAEVEMGEQDTTFLFLPAGKANNITTYPHPVDITIEVITEVEEFNTESAPYTLHPLFDLASDNGSDIQSPFRISSPRHLSNVRYAPKGCFLQTADIDLAGWDDDDSPSNGNFTPIADFGGIYDADARVVANLNITLTVDTGVGLFSQTAPGTASKYVELKNFRLVTPRISRTSSVVFGCGALVGKADSYITISNCVVSGGETYSTAARVSALVGETVSYATISRCANEGCTVTGTSNNAAGILGQAGLDPAPQTRIEYSYNTGTIVARGQWGAGICGTLNSGTTIQYCYNTGPITGRDQSGGIYGRGIGNKNGHASQIAYCWNSGSVTTSGAAAGGIGGTIQSLLFLINDCYNTGTVSAPSMSAGIAGNYTFKTVQADAVKNCYNIGQVGAAGFGIIGNAGVTSDKIVTGCFYLDSTAEAGGPAAITGGITAQADEQMKDFSTYIGWSTVEWKGGEGSYLYPTLINNPPLEAAPAQR